MSQPPIDVPRLVLRGLRAIDDARQGVTRSWERLTGTDRPSEPPLDRRRPPGLW